MYMQSKFSVPDKQWCLYTIKQCKQLGQLEDLKEVGKKYIDLPFLSFF